MKNSIRVLTAALFVSCPGIASAGSSSACDIFVDVTSQMKGVPAANFKNHSLNLGTVVEDRKYNEVLDESEAPYKLVITITGDGTTDPAVLSYSFQLTTNTEALKDAAKATSAFRNNKVLVDMRRREGKNERRLRDGVDTLFDDIRKNIPICPSAI